MNLFNSVIPHIKADLLESVKREMKDAEWFMTETEALNARERLVTKKLKKGYFNNNA